MSTLSTGKSQEVAKAVSAAVVKGTPSGSSKIFDEYRVKLTLLRDMLGTNPADPYVLDTHIHERQRKIIMEKSQVNTTVNKYLGQADISPEKSKEEIERTLAKLEEMVGYKFTAEQREAALSGKLDELKETFEELDTKGTTVFFWDKETNRPCIGDHMIYGYLKAAAEAICRTKETKKGTVMHSASYTQMLINQHVRCTKQFIVSDRDIRRDEHGHPKHLQRSLRVITAQGPRVTLAKSEIIPAGSSFEFNIRVMKNSAITEDVLRELFSYGEYFCGLGQWRNAGYGLMAHELEVVHEHRDKHAETVQ